MMTEIEVEAFQAAIRARGAATYAGFFLAHLRPDMSVLDCGCGSATITTGLAAELGSGRVVGVDLERDGLATARRYAERIGQDNIAQIGRAHV